MKEADFFKEFSGFVDLLATNIGHLLILGDFNIHWDCQRNADTKQLADILWSANHRHHIKESTHIHDHILELVTSRDEDNLIKVVSVFSMLSDHFLVNFKVYLQKQTLKQKVFHLEELSRLIRRLFLLACECMPLHMIHLMMRTIWWISMILHIETLWMSMRCKDK